MKQLYIILLIIFYSCNNVENKTYYDSGNLKTIKTVYCDSINIVTRFYDNDKKQKQKVQFQRTNFDSIAYFYKNGNLFKTGKQTKKGLKFDKWNYFTKAGNISETREFIIIKGNSTLNQNLYFNKNKDTLLAVNPTFNKYDQSEFRNDTLTDGRTNYAFFQFSDKTLPSNKITISNPLKAVVYLEAPIYRNQNSEIMVLLAKEKQNFNEDFSNEAKVKFDTFYCVKKDKTNGYLYKKSNQNLTSVFGRRFKSSGNKTLRGFVREFYNKNLEQSNKYSKVIYERRIYFVKRITVEPLTTTV